VHSGICLERIEKIVRCVRLAGPDRDEQRDRQVWQPLRQVEEEAERCTVCPVRVVDKEQ
jgi:hypothetical protein